jgi:DNA polymerase elongation subunit (family B)
MSLSNTKLPKLNIAFFDIETDFDPEKGFADPSDPFMPITSISVYLQWLETMVCLAVPPKTLTMDEAKKELEGIDNVMLFEKEGDMIDTFLTLIEDADILSGWNSEGYDIPYTVNRTSRVLSKDDTRRFCLWKQLPKKREYEKYGKYGMCGTGMGQGQVRSQGEYVASAASPVAGVHVDRRAGGRPVQARLRDDFGCTAAAPRHARLGCSTARYYLRSVEHYQSI